MNTAKKLTAALMLTLSFTLLFAAAVQAKTYNVKQEKEYRFEGDGWYLYRTTDYKYDSKGRQTKITEKYKESEYDEAAEKVVYTDHTRVETFKYKGKEMIQDTDTEDGKEVYKYKVDLDKKGKIKAAYTYSDGKLQQKRSMKYNKKGILTSATAVVYSGKKSQTIIYTYSYDSKGRVKKVVGKKNKKIVSTDTCTYTKNRKTRVIKDVDMDGNEYSQKMVFDYYPSGKTKKESYTYSSAEGGTSSDTYYYDKQGRLTRVTGKSEGYSSVDTYEKGKIVKSVRTSENNGKKTVSTSVYTYKKSKKGVTERLEKLDGVDFEKIVYSY